MADCEPAAAVWLVANRALGHRVVTALVGSSKHEARIPLDAAEIRVRRRRLTGIRSVRLGVRQFGRIRRLRLSCSIS